MFAINHAATALLFKRRDAKVSLVPVLLAMQAMEFAWVLLNYLGVERTTTESEVRYIGDIHLVYMPYSHSVLTVLAVVVLVWLLGAGVGRARLGAILGLAILSHLALDLLTHNGDIALGPFPSASKYGTFLFRDFRGVVSSAAFTAGRPPSFRRRARLQLFEPSSNNGAGGALFMGFRELKRGAPGGSHCDESQSTGTNRFSSWCQLRTTRISGAVGVEVSDCSDACTAPTILPSGVRS